MTFAKNTKVPVDRTRGEIEKTLGRYGADRFLCFTEQNRAVLIFEAHLRRLRFDLPLPDGSSEKDKQKCRQKWRALLLAIKSKLESVESHIETFEEAFLSHIVMPDGLTVAQHTKPRIEAAYKGKSMQSLLPAPPKKE